MAILRKKKPSSADVSAEVRGVYGVAQLLEFAKAHGIQTHPLDARSLIKALGIGLRIFPMPAQSSGFLKREEGRWVIGVNSLHHPKRQLFTMAHELGHYFLHRETVGEIEDSILFRADDFGVPGIEREANEFAARLLMPESEFRDKVTTLNGNIEQLSDDFGVSSMAVSLRARELGFREKSRNG